MLTRGVRDVIKDGVPGAFVEIGLREGGGTKVIIDALPESPTQHVVIALDPYGNILYQHDENTKGDSYGYTNDMRNRSVSALYRYVSDRPAVNFLYYAMEDVEFFRHFANGVPVYNNGKALLNEYAFVFVDGPHFLERVLETVDWFNDRTLPGAQMVFDNTEQIRFAELQNHMEAAGWQLLEHQKDAAKARFQKI